MILATISCGSGTIYCTLPLVLELDLLFSTASVARRWEYLNTRASHSSKRLGTAATLRQNTDWIKVLI